MLGCLVTGVVNVTLYSCCNVLTFKQLQFTVVQPAPISVHTFLYRTFSNIVINNTAMLYETNIYS